MREQPHLGGRKILQQVALRDQRVDLRRKFGCIPEMLEVGEVRGFLGHGCANEF